eukprot:1515716-Pleurochrysis_carterae.AAC.1
MASVEGNCEQAALHFAAVEHERALERVNERLQALMVKLSEQEAEKASAKAAPRSLWCND